MIHALLLGHKTSNKIGIFWKPIHKITCLLCDSIVFIGGERTEMSELIEEERGAEGRKSRQGRRNTAVPDAASGQGPY